MRKLIHWLRNQRLRPLKAKRTQAKTLYLSRKSSRDTRGMHEAWLSLRDATNAELRESVR